MKDRWLSVNEIAAYLGITTESVSDGSKARVGRRWKFRKEEVDEWVRSGGATDKVEQDQPG